MRLARFLAGFRRDVRGTSAVEYGILLGLIVIGLFAAVAGVADETKKMWGDVQAKSAKAIGSP